MTSFFFCHTHCQENNLSQVTMAKWIISSTCGTHFLGVFSPLAPFPFLFSGPLKKKTKKTCWFLIAFFGTYSVFHSFLSLQMVWSFPRKQIYKNCALLCSFSVLCLFPISPPRPEMIPWDFTSPSWYINVNWDAFCEVKMKFESQFSYVAQNIFQCCRNVMGTWWKGSGSLSLK